MGIIQDTKMVGHSVLQNRC